MSALAIDPMERVKQMIDESASGLRNDIGTIVIAADAKFVTLEAAHNVTIGGIITTSERLFKEIGDKIAGMIVSGDKHDKHIEELQTVVQKEIDSMKTILETFSDSVRLEVNNLRVLAADHEAVKQKMDFDLKKRVSS